MLAGHSSSELSRALRCAPSAPIFRRESTAIADENERPPGLAAGQERRCALKAMNADELQRNVGGRSEQRATGAKQPSGPMRLGRGRSRRRRVARRIAKAWLSGSRPEEEEERREEEVEVEEGGGPSDPSWSLPGALRGPTGKVQARIQGAPARVPRQPRGRPRGSKEGV